MKIVEKNVIKENLRDRFGHEIFLGEYYLKRFYLQKSGSKNVYFTPDEISELFVEMSNDLIMNWDVYLKLLTRM